MNEPNKTLDRFWEMPLPDLLALLKAVPVGLPSAAAKQRLEDLKRPAVKQLYDDLRKFNPKPVASRESELPGEAPSFAPDALPAISKSFRGIKPAPAGLNYNFIKWYVPLGEQKYTLSPN